MCTRRFGDSFDGLEPCHTTEINSHLICSKLPESKGWREYRWMNVKPRKVGAGCGRSLVSKGGKFKRADISKAMFSERTREVGGAHSTYDCSANKSPNREGAVL